jgi:hypothetical protein
MNEETRTAALKVGAAVAGAGASWTLSDFAALVAIISGALAGLYALLQMYVLWRDKIKQQNDAP